MKRKFQYELLETIPVLSWLMRVDLSGLVYVKHGKMVECKPGFFVSGVWAGDFLCGDFVSSNFACCSGAVLDTSEESRIVVSTPSHLQEALFLFKSEDKLFLSNSLSFLLSETDQELDADYYEYEADFCSIIFGEQKMRAQTQLKGGETILFYRNCNIIISENLSIQQESKNMHHHFNNYDEYYNYLHDVLSDIVKNATDKNRIHRYDMISTISRGYDAAAVSALVFDLGCKEVMTLRVPADDNGKEIAHQLGYQNVYEIEREEYKNNNSLLEAEAAASGQVGGMIFEAYEKMCAGKLILLGTRGDSVWERLQVNVNNDLAFPFNGFSQASLSPVEHLFRINSIIVHVPLIAADSWLDIAKISKSSEMKFWSVRDKYDRPIARRILEEKDVKRNDFGQIKKGAGISFHFNTLGSLKQKMSPKSYKSLILFKNKLKRNKKKELLQRCSFILTEFPIYFNYLMSRLRLKYYLNDHSKGHKSSPISNLLILWGVNEMTKRYKI